MCCGEKLDFHIVKWGSFFFVTQMRFLFINGITLNTDEKTICYPYWWGHIFTAYFDEIIVESKLEVSLVPELI